jgi:hypothetical protein
MKVQNRLKELLDQLGFENYQPTDQMLTELGGMSRKRFRQILDNTGKQDLDVHELQLLRAWLTRLQKRVATMDITLLVPEGVEV